MIKITQKNIWGNLLSMIIEKTKDKPEILHAQGVLLPSLRGKYRKELLTYIRFAPPSLFLFNSFKVLIGIF